MLSISLGYKEQYARNKKNIKIILNYSILEKITDVIFDVKTD